MKEEKKNEKKKQTVAPNSLVTTEVEMDCQPRKVELGHQKCWIV